MHRILSFCLVAAFLLLPLAPPASASVAARPPDQDGVVTTIVANMTPAEKVGQLFLVTYYGPSAAPGTDIDRLISQYHVGGVVLLASHDNITDTANAPLQVLRLANQLQTAASLASQVSRPPAPGERSQAAKPYVPLFIALSQEGDAGAFSTVRSGLTWLPNAMAIGATWDARHAEAMGRIVGEELAALGINMLLGPSLDVLDNPRPLSSGDLGTRTFGGDPFWVGVMGQAYIRGVHAGSEGRLAVIAKHFPGLGSSDRNPDTDQDVPTVHRVLEQLKQVELVPFLAVAGAVTDTANMADGLLTTHIRYVGFQGNPRQTTNPVSFDQQALGQLLSLPDMVVWRARGGVMVSDALGVRAVKRFYDPTERIFNNKRIAREAFAAGNDLLYLAEFGRNPPVDQTNTIIDTLTYFAQQYETDPVFAEKVDAAVHRIVSLKLRLYDRFDPELTLRPETGLADLGKGEDNVRSLAQAAASLIGLTPDELAARAPEAPSPNERLVFFTDARTARQCLTCPAYPLLDKRALERAVVRLFGPDGSAQVREGNLQSYTFDDLAAYLNATASPGPTPGEGTPTPPPSPLEAALNSANWIVFSMLSVAPDVPSSDVIRAFLNLRPELARNKKIVVFAFNAPYYLDTTDVSKLTAFYALYSPGPAFVDTAARLLFRDLVPRGASPVSVLSIGYQLSKITAPDPEQIIEITADRAQGNVGDTIRLETGIIYDWNGHAVPDGTPVRFLVLYKDQVLPALLQASTKAGVASTNLTLNRIGQLEIRAESEPALASLTLQINVQADTPFEITVIAPTEAPTATPEPTPTPTPEPPTPTPSPTPVVREPENVPGRVAGRDFFMMCLGLAASMLVGYRIGAPAKRRGQRLRVALAGAIGVLLGYNYYALGLPGANLALPAFGVWAASSYVLIGAALGLIAGWYWFGGRGER